jgi:hypothetical protein
MKKIKIGKKTGLRYFDINNIREWKPCYDPKKRLSENWRGTALTILKNDNISVPDRFWVVLRTDLVSEKLMRLFAVWCARQVQHLMKDPRSLNALDVVERFANGQASKAELDAAKDAARAAAWDAAKDAARAAAEVAARDAAEVAAWDAARDAARDAAWDAARAAAWDAQVKKLIEMVEIEAKNRITQGE